MAFAVRPPGALNYMINANPLRRPATSTDVELARPRLEELAEIEHRKQEAEDDLSSDERGTASKRRAS
jgi:hypothetical protein